MKSKSHELVVRYKNNYKIPDEIEITGEMVINHWELEKKLAKELLDSSPEERWEKFDHAYTYLYETLDWLNLATPSEEYTPFQEECLTWLTAIGTPPQKIYEIGSGQGRLISYLADHGFECKGTEITRERGKKLIDLSSKNISWGNSDGIHLDHFEKPGTYDVVISRQVIEHFHPGDLLTHLERCYNILKKQGRYLLSTPHCHTGPHDISRVFNCHHPQGMHLKEYTYHELLKAARTIGYRKIYCTVPIKFRKLCTSIGMDQESQIITVGSFYFRLMLVMEKILFLVPKNFRSNLSKSLRKPLMFRDNIFLVLQK